MPERILSYADEDLPLHGFLATPDASFTGARPLVLSGVDGGRGSENLNIRDRYLGWNPAYEGVFLVSGFASGNAAHDSAPPNVGELAADASA